MTTANNAVNPLFETAVPQAKATQIGTGFKGEIRCAKESPMSSSRQFSKVSPLVWHSRRFRSLDADGQLLFLYFLTCEHQTSAGTFRIPDGYAIADLNWELPRYIETRGRVRSAGLIDFDEDEGFVQVMGWFEFNPPTNEKHHQGTLRLLKSISSERLREASLRAFEGVAASRPRGEIRQRLSRIPPDFDYRN